MVGVKAFVGWVRRGGDFGTKQIAFAPRRRPTKTSLIAQAYPLKAGVG